MAHETETLYRIYIGGTWGKHTRMGSPLSKLVTKEEILPISARFIANKSGYKFKREAIDKIVAGLEEQLKDK